MIKESDRKKVRKIYITKDQAIKAQVFILRAGKNLKWKKQTKPQFIGFRDITYDRWEALEQYEFFYINFIRNDIDSSWGDSITELEIEINEKPVYMKTLDIINSEYKIKTPNNEAGTGFFLCELEYRLKKFKENHSTFKLLDFVNNEHFIFVKMPATAKYGKQKQSCEVWTLSLITEISFSEGFFKIETCPISEKVIF